MSQARAAFLVVLLASFAPAHAGDGAVGNARPAAQAKPVPSAPLKATSKANPCSEFGPGFAAVEGSSTCVRVGGALQIGASSSANH